MEAIVLRPVNYTSNIVRNTLSFENWGIFSDINLLLVDYKLEYPAWRGISISKRITSGLITFISHLWFWKSTMDKRLEIYLHKIDNKMSEHMQLSLCYAWCYFHSLFVRITQEWSVLPKETAEVYDFNMFCGIKRERFCYFKLKSFGLELALFTIPYCICITNCIH